MAERIFAVGFVHVFHFSRGCPDLGWWQGVAGIGERRCHFSREKLRSAWRVQENEKLVVTFRAPFAMRGVYALAVFLSRRPGVVVGSVSRSWAADGVVSNGNSLNRSVGCLNRFCPQDIERRFPGSPPAGSAPTGSRRGAFCSPQVTRRINPRGPLFRCSRAPSLTGSPLTGFMKTLQATHRSGPCAQWCAGFSRLPWTSSIGCLPGGGGDAGFRCQRSSSLSNCVPHCGLQADFLVDLP